MKLYGDDGIKIFVFLYSLHTWHIKVHAIHSGYFRLFQVHSQVSENDPLENDEE